MVFTKSTPFNFGGELNVSILGIGTDAKTSVPLGEMERLENVRPDVS